MQNIRAESVVSTAALAEDIAFFEDRFGFRMQEIFPADDPREAVLTGHGTRLRLRRAAQGSGVVRLLANDPILLADGVRDLASPGGIAVEIADLAPAVVTPVTQQNFTVRRLADQAPWIVGRAGMQYRDLIPDRLGGAIIASHIRIPDAGPVPDMVHFHSVGFQLIFCYKGWVDLVYEDQGPPFRLEAGNCVIQPPEIRHRVLYASEALEVIEVGVPAEHLTTIDHDLELPTRQVDAQREWAGQRFVHHRAAGADWRPARLRGFEARDTSIAQNTGGVAAVHVLRPAQDLADWTTHSADILFSFLLSGEMCLEGADQPSQHLTAGDAFVIPPGMKTRYSDASAALTVLEVALPGQFETKVAR